MNQMLRGSCCVCGSRDERALVEVALAGGGSAILCGTHALMHNRARLPAWSTDEIRRRLRERRGGDDRRSEGDELGEALTQAFNGERRGGDRRRAAE
jgi:hypothetical protein